MPMLLRRATPALRLVVVVALGVVAVGLAASTAANQPVTGHAFVPGDRLNSSAGATSVRQLDLLPEPGEIDEDEALDRFFARQDRFVALLAGDGLAVRPASGGERIPLEARERGVDDLPALFWIQAAVGLGALLISGWVWSLRPRDLASGLFALSGLSTLAFTLSAAVYSTRELALPADLFLILRAFNTGGSCLFGIAMIALFLVYPVRLRHWRPLMALTCLVFGAWTLAAIARWVPAFALGNLVTLTEMVAILLAILAQYVATRGQPRARAILTWFGLSVLIGAGGFIALNALPLVLGREVALDQAFAFLFFLVIYLGLAAGLRRYRLFELDGWAFRILFNLAGAALLLALDAVLVLAVSMEPAEAFGVALIAIAFLYLPLRDELSRRFTRSAGPRHRGLLFESVVDVALTPPGADKKASWRALLERVFDPLALRAVTAGPDVAIEEDGLALVVPAVGDLPAMRLEHGHGGRRLFSPRDRGEAREMVSMLRHALESRRAYEEGVAEERARIARDMHDNIGARLLGALHNPVVERKDGMIRETLSDLRDIINNAARSDLSLEETLADLRQETAERLSSAGIALSWRADAQAPPLAPQAVQALRSIIREAVSNVIRHAGAHHVDVALTPGEGGIVLQVSDDGAGFDVEGAKAGNGLANMHARLTALSGRMDLVSREDGTTLTAIIPT